MKHNRTKYNLILTCIILITFVISVFTIYDSTSTQPPRLRPGSGDTLYLASNDLFSTSIGTKKGEPKVTFSVGESQLGFVLAGAKSVTPVKKGNTLTFKNVLDDTDLRYETTVKGLKEELILNQTSSSNTFLFDLRLNNVSPTPLTRLSSNDQRLSTIYSPSFKDKSGNYLFHFEPPFAVDASGNRTDNVILQIGHDQQLPDQFFIKLIVDEVWLNDPARVYPITIDPTVVHDTTAEFAAGVLNRVKDVGSGIAPMLTTYYQELPKDEYTVGLWHMNEGTDNTCTGGQDVCDKSNLANHGTFYGNMTFSSDAQLGGYSTSSDGTNDEICFGDVELTNGKQLTIEAWFKFNSLTEYESIVAKNSATWSYALQGDTTSGILRFWVDNNDYTTDAQSDASVVDGKWHHAAGVYDGTLGSANTKLYIDGILQSQTANQTIDIPNTADQLCMGGYNTSGGGSIDGKIDEVRISNIARSPEEIKKSASRRPYSVYTSDVIDFTSNIASWNPLTWSEHGVATGDGETLANSTNLVAQWNFNETSGTTADNAEGTAVRDLTLSGFDSTASQDADPDSSWTANNKRWGAGALQFDGVNSYAYCTDANCGGTNSLDIGSGAKSWEAWVKTSASTGILISKGTTATYSYELGFTSGQYYSTLYQSGGSIYQQVYSNTIINDGKWHHIATTWNPTGTTQKTYVDGKLANSSTSTSGTLHTDSTAEFRIGVRGDGVNYSNAVIDSTRIYNRELAASEIMSNYQAGNIEIQTRVGADTSPDDGSWEAWKPTTGEAAIDTYDGPYQYTTNDSNLKSYWHFDETANNTCTGGANDACDPVSNFDLVDSGGSKIVEGKFGKARSFDGTGDNLSCTDANCGGTTNLDAPTGPLFTLTAWIKTSSTTAANRVIVSKKSALGPQDGYAIYLNSSHQLVCKVSDGVNSATSTSTASYNDGLWHSIVCRSNGSALILYVDGVQVDSSSTTTVGGADTASDFTIGALSGGGSLYFSGEIDEVRFINNTALTATEAMAYHATGSTNSISLNPSKDTLIEQEGSADQKIQTGRPVVETNTVALWHMEETNAGNGKVKDSTTNAVHLTTKGSPITTKGISGKAKNFNGSADYLCTDTNTDGTCDDSNTMDLTTALTFSAWIKTNAIGAYQSIFDKSGAPNFSYIFNIQADGTLRGYICDTAACTAYSQRFSSSTLKANTWYHVAMTWYSNTYPSIYINGVLDNGATTGSTGTYADIGDTSSPFSIGASNLGATPQYFFDGIIDEAKVDNVARSAEEIAEAYRAGRDHYINKTISSTDLSSKTSLPFYVAADRPGSYLSATIGESAYANYQPDTNTVGLWHLDEQSGTTNTYIKDVSGNVNHSTAISGTTLVPGKIGKARNFASGNLITVADSSSLDFGTGAFSVEFWFNTTTTNKMFFDKRTNGGNYGGYYANIDSNGYPNFGADDCTTGGCGWTGGLYATTAYNDGKWHHFVGVRSSSTNLEFYLDGKLVANTTSATSGSVDNAASLYLGGIYNGTGEYVGSLDEIRFVNTALTATEIRQAYEVGLRTHPITIDFASAISHSDPLSSSGDLTFTLMATPSGYTNAGDFIYKGDKIIVRENYDGTEYLAQGTVDSVNVSTGATTVSAWDGGSTFPTNGFGPNSTVFKWQREYWNINNEVLDTHVDAITNLTLRLTDGSEGRTVYLDDLRSSGGYLTTNTGSTITSSTGYRYGQYRIINTSFDEAVSATVSAITLDYVLQTAPNTPTLDAPTDTATNQLLSPLLKTTATDSQSDYLRYKIELCTNVGMSVGCQTFDQTSSQTGWSGQNAQTSTAYTSGTQATYTIQTPLSAATTYYWRSYAIDPGGTNSWSSTQGTPYSFTTSATPSIPTLDAPSNTATNQSLAPALKTTATDANSDYIRYKIELCTNLGMSVGCQTFDQTSSQTGWSGQNTQTSTAYTSGTQATYTLQSNLTPLTTYFWRSYAIDPGGSNTWSATQSPNSFTTHDFYESFSCLINETADDSSLTIVWVDRETQEDSYKLERSVDGAAFAAFQTLAANTTSYQDTSITNGHTYQYRVAPYQTSSATYGDWCTTSTLSIARGDFNFENIIFR